MIIPRQCRGIFSSCFHSSCFPSEWEDNQSYLSSPSPDKVSIQVVFPASGKPMHFDAGNTSGNCFHSSCFPSEWEAHVYSISASVSTSFHSSCFPSEWEVNAFREDEIVDLVIPFKLFSQRVGRTASSSVMLIN